MVILLFPILGLTLGAHHSNFASGWVYIVTASDSLRTFMNRKIKLIFILKRILTISGLLVVQHSFSAEIMGLNINPLSGDFRYRHQNVREDGRVDRPRDRLRLRLGTIIQIEENVQVPIRFATGEQGATALSTNQNLGEGGEKKEIWMDQAYLSWKPQPNFEVRLGKFLNFWREPLDQQLLIDEDLTPEGIGALWSNEDGSIVIHGQAHWLKERPRVSGVETSTDVGFLGWQFGKTWGSSVLTTISYYSLPNLRGSQEIHGGSTDASFSGNSVFLNGSTRVYAYDYEVVSALAQIDFSEWILKDLRWAFQVAQNLAVREKSQALVAGVSLGQLREKRDWQVGYRFRYAEADAVMAGLSDNDLGMSTDSRGHTVFARYQLTTKMVIGLSYFDFMNTISSQMNHWQRYHFELLARF